MLLLRGIITLLTIIVITVLVCIPLFSMAVIALLIPGKPGMHFRRWMEVWLFLWTGFNHWLFRVLRTTNLRIDWPDACEVSKDQWYLVISNHQSWTDILILQSTLWNRLPPIKFFTKAQLIWVPFIGIGMYVLGFPYLQRATKERIARNPELRNADRANIRKACTRFRYYPSTLLNFVEGTRFTVEKHARQRSSYQNLLNAKVGGLSYVIAEMGGMLHRLVDITIAYPGKAPTFWEFLQGKCAHVHVRIDALEIPLNITSQPDEREQRRLLAAWIDERWRLKDQRLNDNHNNSTGQVDTSGRGTALQT
jgi:1-acyl-sn-glycerol-3-phosphate acyltransferase